MPNSFSSFAGFETADERFLRETEQALEVLEHRRAATGGGDPDFDGEVLSLRHRIARFRRFSGRASAAYEKLWWWLSLEWRSSSWTGWVPEDPERWSAMLRAGLGGILLVAAVGAAFLEEQPRFLLLVPAIVLLTLAAVWFPDQRRAIRDALRRLQGRAPAGAEGEEDSGLATSPR